MVYVSALSGESILGPRLLPVAPTEPVPVSALSGESILGPPLVAIQPRSHASRFSTLW